MPQETETSYQLPLDSGKLRLAIEVALAVEQISAAELSRRIGVHTPELSRFRHGQDSYGMQLKVLKWLDMKPSLFLADTPQPRTEAA